MAYQMAPKAKQLSPYDPIEGNYRVRLDANESFLLPTEEDREKLARAAAETALNRYPDPLARDLCAAFARRYRIEPDLVTAGNGSDELISIILSVFLQKGEKVLTLSPDFSMYRFYTAISETPCTVMEKGDDFQIDVDAVLETMRKEKIRLLVFSNPCNPTSVGLKAPQVRRLVQGTDALVVLDEAYMDFWDQSLLPEAAEYDNLIVLRTCSKAIGLAGLRIGFAVANPRLTAVIRAAKSPYNVNAVSQEMARLLLENDHYAAIYPQLLVASRNMLVTGLKKLESEGALQKVYDSCTNFAYVQLEGARWIFERLADNGIIVRCFGDRFLRITAGTQAENSELLSSLRFLLQYRREHPDQGN